MAVAGIFALGDAVKREQLGIYGGRFNPIHYAHLILAQTALELFPLDRIVFLPSGGRICYKEESDPIPPVDRLAMIQRAIGENPRFTCSPYEINRPGYNYTIDTLRYFRDHEYRGCDLVLLIGGDWAHKISSWKEGEQLLREFEVAVFSRPGMEIDPSLRNKAQCKGMRFVEMPLIDISSSWIRERIQNGLPIHYLTPEPVCRYIEEKGLYR